MPAAGTAYVPFVGDFRALMPGLAAALAPAKMSRMGKVAGAGLVAGFAAAGIGKALYDVGKEYDDAFDKIRVGTGKTGKVLDGLKDDLKAAYGTVPSSLDDTATAIVKLNQRLGLTGKPLQKLAEQELNLARITKTDLATNLEETTRVFADFAVGANKQGKALDALFRVSQRSGVGLSDLASNMVKFGSPLRQLGFNFNETAVLFAKFQKEGVNLRTAMPGLRLALGTFAEAGKEPASALRRLIAAIEETKSPGEAYRLQFEGMGTVLEIFGKRAGPDLVAAIQEGRFSFQELMNVMSKGSETINQAAEDTNDFSENWDIFAHKVKNLIEPAASALFRVINDGMSDLVAGRPPDFTKPFRDLYRQSALLRGVFNVIGGVASRAFAGIKQSFQGLAQNLKGVVQVISGVLTLNFKRVWEGVKNIWAGGAKIILGVIRAVTAPLREAAARIGAAIGEKLGGPLEKVKGLFTTLKNVAVTSFNAIKGPVVSVLKTVGGALWDIIRAVVKVIQKFNSLKDKLPDVEVGGVDLNKGLLENLGITGQRGLMVPGSGSGDKVSAMLEPGEVVLNRKAVARMGGARRVNAINAVIPRFAGGGVIGRGVAQAGATGVGMAAISAADLIRALKKAFGSGGPASWKTFDALARKFHLSITSGYRPGDSDSFHGVPVGGGRARATDYSGSARGMMGFATLLRNKYVKRLAELFYDPLGGWDNGVSIGPIGGHADHVHVAFQRGGVVGDFARAVADTKANKRAALALFMAGLAESGMRDLPGGHSTSQGVLQLLASTAGSYGINPHNEYAVAKGFLTHGYWGKGGGIELGRRGTEAAAIAHLVQGNATGTGVYSRQGAAALRLLHGSGLRFTKDGAFFRLGKGAGAKDAGELSKKLKAKIAKLALAPKIQAKLNALTTDADVAEEYASRAEQLGGPVFGRDEVGWLHAQLTALFKLRNVLIVAHGQIVAQQAKVDAWLKKTKNKKLREALRGQRSALNDKRGEILSSLQDVQGFTSSKLSMKVLSKLPAVGALGGRIFDVQMRLQQAGADADDTSATDASKGLSAEQLKEIGYLSKLGVKFNPSQFAGMFAGGGWIGGGQWGIAGETGRAEIVQGPARVYSPNDSARMMAPSVRVFIGDRELTDIVRVEVDEHDRIASNRFRQGVR